MARERKIGIKTATERASPKIKNIKMATPSAIRMTHFLTLFTTHLLFSQNNINAFTPSSPFRETSNNHITTDLIKTLPTHLPLPATTPTETTTTTTITSQSPILTENDNESDNSEAAFPPPLTKVDRLKRAATFWSSAVPIVLSYYGKYAELKVREQVLGECFSQDECEIIWNGQHEKGAAKLAEVTTSLKGFYVKTAQIISSRQDLFPEQYTEALSGFTDDLDPMPSALAKAVIERELLNADESFDDVFTSFDDVPLGSASVAQVHRAVLAPKYGGPREVAVKIQRPGIESKLMGDIGNLKGLAKPLRELDAMPLDYYTVFAELEAQLQDEFDFVAESVAMERIYNGLRFGLDGAERDLPLVIPRPVSGLVSKRVLVMDYLEGVPLSRAREEMIKRGVDPESPEAKVFGRSLLGSLTEVFGKSILETGFFHADPHPGNIFVLEDGRIGLIDYGQVKQISGRNRETLAKVMVALANRKSDTDPSDLSKIGKLALELGVKIKPTAKDEAAAAVAFWLFDGSVEELPGGYDKGELSPNSPVKELESFPQDLVLVGRSSILIKGLSNRLNVPWSLSREWAPIAQEVLDRSYGTANGKINGRDDGRTRFRDVVLTLKRWGKGRVEGGVKRLPPRARTRVVGVMLKMQEWKERRRAKKVAD